MTKKELLELVKKLKKEEDPTVEPPVVEPPVVEPPVVEPPVVEPPVVEPPVVEPADGDKAPEMTIQQLSDKIDMVSEGLATVLEMIQSLNEPKPEENGSEDDADKDIEEMSDEDGLELLEELTEQLSEAAA